MRNYRFDNIKCILIILVVLGHFLELPENSTTADNLYRIIYLFHMPAFVFVSGYFAKFNPRKIVRSLICPYIFFQTVYLAFHSLIILEEDTFTLQFTKPYWILWYLMAMIFYYLLIPFFQTTDKRRQILTVSVAVILSLLTGYDSSIGYQLTLSRFFVFLPYFLMGQYFRTNYEYIRKKWEDSAKLHIITYVIAFAGVATSIFYILNSKLSSYVLYGSLHYAKLDYGPSVRITLLFFAICWIIVLFRLLPNKKIPILTSIGKYTFWIFILHGFIVELADKYIL